MRSIGLYEEMPKAHNFQLTRLWTFDRTNITNMALLQELRNEDIIKLRLHIVSRFRKGTFPTERQKMNNNQIDANPNRKRCHFVRVIWTPRVKGWREDTDPSITREYPKFQNIDEVGRILEPRHEYTKTNGDIYTTYYNSYGVMGSPHPNLIQPVRTTLRHKYL